MRTEYHCKRDNGVVRCTVSRRSHEMMFPVVKDLVNIGLHSPDGFEMGYAGSGPADLALTILCDYFGVEANPDQFRRSDAMTDGARLAWDLHQRLKREYIAPHRNAVIINGEQIDEMVADSISIAAEDVAPTPAGEVTH